MKVAVGVRKRELGGVDDASIPPVCVEDSAISARLLAGSLKLGGGAMDVVSEGGFSLRMRNGVGKVVPRRSRAIDFAAEADEIFPK